MPIPPHNYDVFLNTSNQKFSRAMYHSLVSDITVIHGKYIKWKSEISRETYYCETLHQFSIENWLAVQGQEWSQI